MRFEYHITPGIDQVVRSMGTDIRASKRAGMINVVTTVEGRARKYAPVKTSNLAGSGSSNVDRDGNTGIVTFAAPYAPYVHQGTGLYGPHRTKIVPKNKRALFWTGARHPVKSVRGMKGNPFLVRAAQETDMAGLYAEGAQNYLKSGRR